MIGAFSGRARLHPHMKTYPKAIFDTNGRPMLLQLSQKLKTMTFQILLSLSITFEIRPCNDLTKEKLVEN